MHGERGRQGEKARFPNTGDETSQLGHFNSASSFPSFRNLISFTSYTLEEIVKRSNARDQMHFERLCTGRKKRYNMYWEFGVGEGGPLEAPPEAEKN